MSDDGEETGSEGSRVPTPASGGWVEWLIRRSESSLRLLEAVAAVVLVVLFAIGVFDLGLGIVEQIRRGRITDPLIVVGFIDTALLLFIIVEVFQTVLAYTRENDTRDIVLLVVYTGIIAMVRKVIIFRTGEYESPTGALFAAVSYTIIIVGLGVLLLVEGYFRPD